MRHRLQRALALAVLCLGFSAARLGAETNGPGVVVEEVGKGSALEAAGIRPGDLLFAWERPEGEGEIASVFDWSWVTIEQAPRGPVRLYGEREGEPAVFEVARGIWEARARPRMAADHLQMFLAGRRRIAAGDLEGGVALWSRIIPCGEPRELRAWLLLETGAAWLQRGRSAEAQSALRAALAEARGPRTQVALWEALGESYQYAGVTAQAEASFRAALEAGAAAAGESLQGAGTLARLGNVLRLQSRFDAAEQMQNRALEIRQRWAPDSLEVVDSLHQLFLVAFGRGDRDAAMSDLTQRALKIQERWPVDTPAMVDTLNDLGLRAISRGYYAEAVAALQRAAAIQEQRSPDSIALATTLGRLGLAARLLGDTDLAVEALQRALAIRDRLAPASLGTVALLGNLGLIAQERQDLDRAAELFQRGLALAEKAVPPGIGVAGLLDALGTVAQLRGDLEEAWKLHSRALETSEALPNHIDVAVSLSSLGTVAEARGDLARARDFHRRALAIYEEWAPNGIDRVLTLHRIGQIERRMGRLARAAQLFVQAVAALESHVGRSGGSQELQATQRARYAEIYGDAVEVELARGRAAAAFALVERSRARGFLALLEERDLEFPGEIPAALERSRKDNAALYDQALRKAARWTPAAGEEARAKIDRELSRLRRERDGIAAEIRKASPRLAALRAPRPLDLAAARKVLDPGTLALSYSVGKDRTALFAVTREGGLRVKILPVGEARLRRDLERFLEQVRQPAVPTDLARALYRELIRPVAGLVGRSERVLILPDGPLHRLPFGALLRDTGGHGQYLTEWKPLHTALSLTVYGALRARRGEQRTAAAARPARLVAFGDPRYPREHGATGDDPLRRALGPALRGFDWAALPYSRREVERSAEAYPEARLYLGEDATEEQAKSAAREARVLHFATHGYLDDRTPLDSALVLTVPEGLPAGRDNGLLQVWEIFESVRLDADLVVLSTCRSALGREMSGEGLIGLTRAFQYAGARSVVASLWDVTDQVTAELMARFHRHYAAGLAKDEALRAAQREMIHQTFRITTAEGKAVEVDTSAPFFWAAFQVFGDWR
jgi:CHAT domain-containing protein/Tfp pilus assembly protein PilF